ncbi:MAG TPA: hypothetical protein VGK99_19105 [Acidobacteriota bacterium]
MKFLQKFRTFHTPEQFQPFSRQVRIYRQPRVRITGGALLVGSKRGIISKKPDGSLEPFPADRLLPWNEVTVLSEQRPGIVWVGTTRGAIRYDSTTKPETVQYFAGKRWLPDDRVVGIGFEGSKSHVSVWIETPGGFSRIEFLPVTLDFKAELFEKRVRERHVRHGLVARSNLRIPGNLSSNQTTSSDNDGLWTAMYVAAECFRYVTTGEAAARNYARQSMAAILRLESITGIPGFPARSFIKRGVEARPGDGEWHTTADGDWEWKGDTSSDEIVGHYFVYPIYYDLCADDSERAEIRAVVNRITSHILDHGFHLVDVDGKPTRWGWWAPDEIWADPDETGLRALHLLSHLKVAHHITGEARYKAVYDELVSHHRYHLLARNQKINIPGHINHSDDELAFLSYYPLLIYETNPELRKIYLQSLKRSWRVERPEQNPLWDLIYAAISIEPPAGQSELSRWQYSFASARKPSDFDASVPIFGLQRIPVDLIAWDVRNSHRLDITRDPSTDRFRLAQSLIALAPEERPMLKWNGNPYLLDGGGGGREEDDGAFFLLPYWLGRFHGMIQ